MEKLTTIILVALLILSLVGCASTNKTADPDVSTSDTDTRVDSSTSDTDTDGANDVEQSKETAQSYDNVPGTNVPIYPNSQQVDNSMGLIIYATTDSGEVIKDFYKSHPDLTEGKGSGSYLVGYYFYKTPLADLVVRACVGDTGQEEIDEMNAYINEFGGLTGLHIYDVNMDSEQKKLSFGGRTFEELPLDKTLIMYGFQEKL